MVLNLMDHMLKPGDRLVELNVQTPSIEISLMSKPGQWILHLIQYSAKRYSGITVIEEIPMRYDIPVSFRPPAKPKRVYLAPSLEEPEWTWEDGIVDVTVPELHIHQIVVLEF